jgi:hypothetical protein
MPPDIGHSSPDATTRPLTWTDKTPFRSMYNLDESQSLCGSTMPPLRPLFATSSGSVFRAPLKTK